MSQYENLSAATIRQRAAPAPDQPPKESPVMEAIQTMNHTLEFLADRVSRLEGRLHLVLRPEQPQEAERGESENCPNSPLLGSLTTLNDAASEQVSRLDRILDRLTV